MPSPRDVRYRSRPADGQVVADGRAADRSRAPRRVRRGRARLTCHAEPATKPAGRSLPTMAVGIVSYGSYVPYRRLKRAAIAQVLGIPAGKGERAVASFDETASRWPSK